MNAPASVPAQAPNSIESEQALLGTLMANNGCYAQCAELGPEDFFEAVNARIYEAMQDHLTSGRPCNPLMLISQFRNDETLRVLGLSASEYVSRLVASQMPPNAIRWLAKQIRNDALLRRMGELASEIGEKAMSPPTGSTAIDLAAGYIDALHDLSRQGLDIQRKQTEGVGHGADEVTTRLNESLMRGVVSDIGAYPGSKTLCEAIGGWRRGRYYVIGGRPGMGKTTVALSWLLRTAGKGHNVVFFSLEMGMDELSERALSDLSRTDTSRIEYQSITRNNINEAGLERLLEAQERLKTLPLRINDRAGLTLAQVRAIATQEAQRLASKGQRLDVICIDHMGLLKASERYAGNKVAETEEISAALKVMAKELDCAVIALMQLNRGVEGRESKRPTLSDLRWSGAIEQDADVVMFCYREAYYLERDRKEDMADERDRRDRLQEVQNRLEVIVAKQRGGACPTLDFFCDMGCAAVRDAP